MHALHMLGENVANHAHNEHHVSVSNNIMNEIITYVL